MSAAERAIIAYGELLAKAVLIVREGRYGDSWIRPSHDMNDSPLLAVVEGNAVLTWNEGDGDCGYRAEAAFPLHLLDMTEAELTDFLAMREAERKAAAAAERAHQEQVDRETAEARDRAAYERLKAKYEGKP